MSFLVDHLNHTYPPERAVAACCPSVPPRELHLSRCCIICTGHQSPSETSPHHSCAWNSDCSVSNPELLGKSHCTVESFHHLKPTTSLEMPLLPLTCLRGHLCEQSLCTVLRVPVSSLHVVLCFSLPMSSVPFHRENRADGKSSQERVSLPQ